MVQKAVIYCNISNITFRLSPCTGTSGWSLIFSGGLVFTRFFPVWDRSHPANRAIIIT